MEAQKFDNAKAHEYVQAKWQEKGGIVETLCKYIEIPNVTPDYDDEWNTNGHQMRAVELLTSWVKAQNVEGLTLEVVKDDNRTPLILMEVPASDPAKNAEPCVLLYGHMDKQPPLTDQWEEGLGPYKPVIRDNKLYGRGGADDGYAIFGAITAINAVRAQGAAHPRCVVLIEGGEESDIDDLQVYIKKLHPRIGEAGLVICLDSGCGDYERLWLTTSLRGILAGTLKVTTLKEGLHSGGAGGIVPSSFRIVRHVLDRLEDSATGRILVDALHVDIPAQRVQQAQEVGAFLDKRVYLDLPLVEGASPVHTEPAELLLNNTWRPQLAVTGADGFPAIKSAGNVLRPYTAVKLSIRLPPTADAMKATAAVKELLEKDPPYGAKVEFITETPDAGWSSPILAPWLDAGITQASQSFFGNPPLQMGEGGSIPFMGLLGNMFPRAQFVITGVLGPGSNAHGPNEFLHIPTGERVTATVALLLNLAASHL